MYISIGPTCYTACLLREAGYRGGSYPFDWLFSSLAMVEHCIRGEFVDFLDVRHLYDISGCSSSHAVYNPMIDTLNLRAHHREHGGGDSFDLKVFNHHNLLDAATQDAFRRRCARFMDALRGEEAVYLVYYNRNTNDCDELTEFVRRMRFRAGVTVIGIIKRDDGGGDEVIRVEEGLVVVATANAEHMMQYINSLFVI